MDFSDEFSGFGLDLILDASPAMFTSTGMNYSYITDNLILGSQPKSPEDIEHLKHNENVVYLLNMQQDIDIHDSCIDFTSITTTCQQLGIHYMRTPVKDCSGKHLRRMLPKAVSCLEWAISQGNGKIYLHCTAGWERSPSVAIAYLFWFHTFNVNTAYNEFHAKRPCGPRMTSIKDATSDLLKSNGLSKESYEEITHHERDLIHYQVRALRGT